MICYGCVKYTIKKVAKGYKKVIPQRNSKQGELENKSSEEVVNNLGKLVDNFYAANTEEEKEEVRQNTRDYLKELKESD